MSGDIANWNVGNVLSIIVSPNWSKFRVNDYIRIVKIFQKLDFTNELV